jgi:hypothetical protein
VTELREVLSGGKMRLCSSPGCGRKVPDSARFCNECQPSGSGGGIREHHPAGRAAPSTRGGVRLSGSERALEDLIQREYMGRPWREVTRPRALRRTPACDDCKVALSQIVDHRIPARLVHAECIRRRLFPLQRIRGFHLLDNLTGLCHSCHNEKTAREAAQDWTDALESLLSRFRPGICFA